MIARPYMCFLQYADGRGSPSPYLRYSTAAEGFPQRRQPRSATFSGMCQSRSSTHTSGLVALVPVASPMTDHLPAVAEVAAQLSWESDGHVGNEQQIHDDER